MTLQEEWAGSPAPKTKLDRLILDWYKQDQIKCQVIIDELERLSKLGEHAVHQNSIICKTWHGRRYEISVLKDGYLYEGELYSNLTAIASKITGIHQSGNVFFGLSKAKRVDNE